VWTKILKFMMVLSFVGALVFVGIAILTNQGITYQSFEYISEVRSKTDFSEFEDNVHLNVRSSYGASGDNYAEFIADSSRELNSGIDYFLNFLSVETNLTKGDHNTLMNGYDNYCLSLDEAQDAYDKYMKAYASVESGIYAQNLLLRYEEFFVKKYLACYQAGSDFFKDLVSTVSEHYFEGKGLNYACQRYLIKVGLSDFACNTMLDLSREAFDASDLKLSFENFVTNEANYADSDIVTNSNFLNFVSTLNKGRKL